MTAAGSQLDLPSTVSLAIIGAGPAGLSLALQAAQTLPDARITVFDARPADKDVAGDPRTLALSLGTVQELQRMGLWDAISSSGQTAPITEVHVSQQQPTVLWPGQNQPEVRIQAREQGVPQLGSVVSYGALVAPLQQAWLKAIEAQPERLSMRFGTPVKNIKSTASGVEVDADIAEAFDFAVVAEGGVFADQPKLQWPQGISRDYGQSAWVGQVMLSADSPVGVAYERFTPAGPAALLPLPPGKISPDGPVGPRAALVWCVPEGDEDPIRGLSDSQRLIVLNTLFHPRVGQITGVSALKNFPLGLNAHRRLVEDGAVVRIGNAAQTLHPVAGQGFNLGMRDVHELLAALQAARPGHALGGSNSTFEKKQWIQAALKRFERRRQPDRLALMATTDFLARSFTFPAPILATMRGLGLGAVGSVGPIKRLIARSMMFGWR